MISPTGRTIMIRYCTFLIALIAASPSLLLHAQSWDRAADLPADEVTALAGEANVLAASIGTTVYLSEDGGASWSPGSPLPGEDVPVIFALTIHDGVIYAGTLGEGVFRSTDGGESWQVFGTGLAGHSTRSILTLLAQGGYLYAGTDGGGVRRIDLDEPTAWHALNEGLPSNVAWTVHALAAAGDVLLAGAGANGHLFVLRPGETAWEAVEIKEGESQTTAYSFVGLADAILAGTSSGVYRSGDGGGSWEPAHVPEMESFDVHALGRGGDSVFALLFGQGQAHVAHSGDEGRSWDVETARSSSLYSALFHNGSVWVASHDGLWRYDLSHLVSAERPEVSERTVRLDNAFPNPFSTSTTIAFELDAPASVALSVFDLLGRRVVAIAEGPHPRGRHEYGLAAAALPAGLYLCRLDANGKSETRSIVLVR